MIFSCGLGGGAIGEDLGCVWTIFGVTFKGGRRMIFDMRLGCCCLVSFSEV